MSKKLNYQDAPFSLPVPLARTEASLKDLAETQTALPWPLTSRGDLLPVRALSASDMREQVKETMRHYTEVIVQARLALGHMQQGTQALTILAAMLVDFGARDHDSIESWKRALQKGFADLRQQNSHLELCLEVIDFHHLTLTATLQDGAANHNALRQRGRSNGRRSGTTRREHYAGKVQEWRKKATQCRQDYPTWSCSHVATRIAASYDDSHPHKGAAETIRKAIADLFPPQSRANQRQRCPMAMPLSGFEPSGSPS